MKPIVTFTFCCLLIGLACSPSTPKIDTKYQAYKSEKPIEINGIADEPVWEKSTWHYLNQNWIGNYPDSSDFHGRFKLSWDTDFLYVLAEIYDDSLSDTHSDPFSQYWDDDCLEIFVDEDASGGEHTYSFNAFAYHIALNGDVVDYGTKGPERFDDHIQSARNQSGKLTVWETRIAIFDDSYVRGKVNTPKKLFAGKRMGFALAYCDNDTSAYRENFMGSEVVEGDNKNRGYIDAGIFGNVTLVN